MPLEKALIHLSFPSYKYSWTDWVWQLMLHTPSGYVCYILLFNFIFLIQRPPFPLILSSCLIYRPLFLFLFVSLLVLYLEKPKLFLVLSWDEKQLEHNFHVYILLCFIDNNYFTSSVPTLVSRNETYNHSDQTNQEN